MLLLAHLFGKKWMNASPLLPLILGWFRCSARVRSGAVALFASECQATLVWGMRKSHSFQCSRNWYSPLPCHFRTWLLLCLSRRNATLAAQRSCQQMLTLSLRSESTGSRQITRSLWWPPGFITISHSDCRVVFVLDASPSLSVVDPVSFKVTLNVALFTDQCCVYSLVKCSQVLFDKLQSSVSKCFTSLQRLCASTEVFLFPVLAWFQAWYLFLCLSVGTWSVRDCDCLRCFFVSSEVSASEPASLWFQPKPGQPNMNTI